jgi:choline dehydrogenase-like flavoprotein
MRSVVLALLAASLLGGCSGNAEEAQAKDLYSRLKEDDFHAWDRAPGWETAKKTVRPHGSTAEIFLNPTLAAALAEQGLDAWPFGAIAVKESDGGKILAAMEKTEDGWFYAEYDRSGTVKYSGKPDVCTNCHDEGDDHLFSVALP